MIGINWNSKNKKYMELKKLSTIEKALNANNLKSAGMSVKDISTILGKSKSRIYEYLKSITKKEIDGKVWSSEIDQWVTKQEYENYLEMMIDDYNNSDKYR